MNKNNENDNKTTKNQSFNNKLAIFEERAKNSQANTAIPKKQDDKNIKMKKIEKDSTQIKNLQVNVITKSKNEKTEDKPKEGNKISNIINQLNKNEESKKNIITKNEENEINNKKENNSIKNDNKNNKENKENKENKNIVQKIEKEKNNTQDKKDKNIIEDKKNITNNNIVPKETNNNFKEKINIFQKNSNEEDNKNKIQNININKEVKNNNSNTNNDEIVNKNNSKFKSSAIQESVKKIEEIQKDKKEIKGIKNENIKKDNSAPISKITNENKEEKIPKKIDENKKNEEKMNSIMHRATVYTLKSKENTLNTKENENNKPKISHSKEVNQNNTKESNSTPQTNSINALQQKIQNFEKKNSDITNKTKIEIKPKDKKNRYDPSILEKLKLFYQPKKNENDTKQEQKNTNLNKNNLNNNDNSNVDKNENKNKNVINSKEKEIPSNNLVSMKENMNIQNIKNQNKEDEMTMTNKPGKLNLKEIFKNMNIEQVASNVKVGNREEIIKFAQKKKEEENKIISNEQENESDNDDDEEKEKEDEIYDPEFEENYEKRDLIEESPIKAPLNGKEGLQNVEPGKNNQVQNDKKITNNNINQIKNENDAQKGENIRRKSTINISKDFLSNMSEMILKRQNNNDFNKNNEIIKNQKNDENTNTEKDKEIKPDITKSVRLNPKEENSNKTKKLNKSLGFKDFITFNSSQNENKKIEKELHNTMPNFNSDKNKSEKINEKSLNEETFLEKETVSKDIKLKKDSFCESFFLASFSKENGQIMDNSEDDNSECNHFTCSFLPAMQPEILYKYPKEDIKGLEINNLAASICFPNGIKLCYEENEGSIKTVQNYRSSFTNQVGDRFFAVIYHFYLKMINNEFEYNYNMTPFKNKISAYQDELCTTLNDELEEDIYAKLTKYEDIICRKKYVYIPFCLCLISKYPFIEQMEKCLESIMISINNKEADIKELNRFITYIVKSIPAPPLQSKIFFPIPNYNKFIEIQNPYFRDITQFGDNPIIILNYLSISHILCLFKLLIFEQKVLVVGKNNDIISQIILNFVSLLYPFEWIHTYIPVMSEKMLKFLQSFLPFFNGINISLYLKAIPILSKASKGVFIFNIDEDKIEINSNLKTNISKKTKASSYINRHLPNFPKNIENLIIKELKLIKYNYKHAKENYDKYNSNIKIKNLFIQVFIELLYDYKKYSYIIDDYPVFNSFLLVKDKSKNDKNFFKEFSTTQLFQMFVQNSLFNENDKKSYFEDRLNEFIELKKAGTSSSQIHAKLYENFKNEYNSYFQINNNYIIKPFFIKEFEKFEENYTSKNKIMKLSNANLFLSKQYEAQNDSYLNNHGVLKENRRIIEKPIELDNKNDPEEYNIFLIPGQKIENLIYKKENNNSESNSSFKKTKSIKMGIISEEDNNENKIRYSQNLPNKEYELTEDERDEIKDNIREIMTRVYRSEVNKIDEDKKTIIESMKIQFGRDYFVNILNTGNNNDRTVKLVIEESYIFFRDVIFSTLLDILKLEENEYNVNIAIKLLKASLFIKTTKNKKEILLSDDLFFKLENYSLFTKNNFWKEWVEDDMTEKDLEIITLKKKSNEEFYYIDEESEKYKLYFKHVCDIIEGLPSIMMKMKLKNFFIYSTVSELCQEYVFEDKFYQQVMQEVISEIQLYKKLSN